MKKTKLFTRILSMVLSLLIIFYVIPSTVYAEIASLSSEGNSESTNTNSGVYTTEKSSFEIESNYGQFVSNIFAGCILNLYVFVSYNKKWRDLI